MEKKLILSLLFIIIFSFIMGFGAGWLVEYSFSQNQLRFWQQLLEKHYPPLPQVITEFDGTVTKIENSSIWVKYKERVSRFPLPEGKEYQEREIKVIIEPFTEFEAIKIVENENKVLMAQTVPISFDEIKVGSLISVIAKDNIKGQSEVRAQKITLLQ